MTPHAEKLVAKAIASRHAREKLRAELETAMEIYRADLAAALATGERGVQKAIADGAGVSRETIRVDANEQARVHRREAKRVKPEES